VADYSGPKKGLIANRAMLVPTRLRQFLILLLLLVALALRLGHWEARIFHIDEYISMLAAQMTLLKGAPILPSGLLYHQGLLTSYLAAPLLGLLGFSEEIARWPSLLAGVLTVAAFYRVARQLLFSQTAGLLALSLATLDTSLILWSGRMRMYALAGLLMLLGLYFLLQGTLLRPSRAYRLAAAGCYLAAILAHSVAVVIVPVWGVALLICLAVGQPHFKFDWYRQKSIVFELILGLFILSIALGFSIGGQLPFLSAATAEASQGGESGLVGVFNKFLDPGVSWRRIDDFVYYYTGADYGLLTGCAGFSLLWAFVALSWGRFTRRDLMVLFLGLVVVLTLAELGLALTSTWRKTRYLFILCHPAYLLLAADGLTRLLELAAYLLTRWLNPPSQTAKSPSLFPTSYSLLPTPHFASLLPILGLSAIFWWWAAPALAVAQARGTGGYDTAFQWVKQHWQEGDQVMTVHPSAAYLYLGRSDYYATQSVARVLRDDEDEELVDRYIGSTLVDSLAGLSKATAESKRLWFVVDTDRLFSRYEPLFAQQVFAQMKVMHQAGTVLVFLSQPYPRLIPPQPTYPLNANFNQLVELGGYSLDMSALAPDRTVQLVLYWRPLVAQLPQAYKVFVQVRNTQNQNVAQADHFIFAGFLPNSALAQLKDQGEWLRDAVALAWPEHLAPGSYRLLVGLYDPTTFERLPLISDTSGENAVLLETILVP
jgi:hypothetical protein